MMMWKTKDLQNIQKKILDTNSYNAQAYTHREKGGEMLPDVH